MKSRNEVPSTTRRLRLMTAAGAAAGIIALAPSGHAQIEVDVLTSAPESAAHPAATPQPADGVSATSILKQDPSADQAAQKILPAPGTEMKSTEDGSRQAGTNAVAAEPSLKMDQNSVVMNSGETTETLAVKSGAELLKILGLQLKKEDAGEPTELDEATSGVVFDVGAIKRLKGSDPTVVYRVVIDEVPLPDPMIVPWIRQAKLLQERFDKAVQLLGENQLEDGRQELVGIISDFPDSDYAVQAKALLAKLDDLNKPIEVPTAAAEPEKTTVTVELSPNIQIGTVIVDPENPVGNRAMIAGRAYKAGDEIRGVPNHRVVSITDSIVQIEVEQSGMKKIFDVPVRPRGATE